jgi:hypothetical protein
VLHAEGLHLKPYDARQVRHCVPVVQDVEAQVVVQEELDVLLALDGGLEAYVKAALVRLQLPASVILQDLYHSHWQIVQNPARTVNEVTSSLPALLCSIQLPAGVILQDLYHSHWQVVQDPAHVP